MKHHKKNNTTKYTSLLLLLLDTDRHWNLKSKLAKCNSLKNKVTTKPFFDSPILIKISSIGHLQQSATAAVACVYLCGHF